MSATTCVPWSDRRPGPSLGADLAAVDPAALPDDELIDVMAAWRRQASWAQAGELAAVAELARRRESGASRNAEFTSAEVGLALGLSPRSADAHTAVAVALAERLPLTRKALADGHIDFLKARVIAQGTAAVDAGVAAAVERRVLARASDQTPGRLRSSVERAVMALDPGGAERRRKASEAERRVDCHDTGNGTAVLGGVHLPAGPAIAADNRLHAIARAIKAGGDPRTLDQLSADVFLSLLLGVRPGPTPSSATSSGITSSGTTSCGTTLSGDTSSGTTRSGASSGAASSGTAPFGTTRSGAASSRAMPNADSATTHHGGDGGHECSGALSTAGPGDGGDPRNPLSSEALPSEPLPLGPVTAGEMARAVGRRIGTVQLTVPLRTLLGLSAEPGDVAGYGPITAEVARQMASAASDPKTRWCVTVTGSSGEPVHHGHLGYRPPAEMAHVIRILQPTCAFPGCGRPATACDLDHRVPYDRGGATCPCNMSPLCRRHHRAKQADGWRLTEHEGRFRWTTPAGKTYEVSPHVPDPGTPLPAATGHRPNGPPSRSETVASSLVEERRRNSRPEPPPRHPVGAGCALPANG